MPDGSNLYALIGDSEFKKSNRHRYHDLGPDGRFTPESTVDVIGLLVGADAVIDDAAAPEDGSGAGTSASSLGDVHFGFHGSYFAEFATLPAIRHLIDVIVEVWQPARLEVGSGKIRTAALDHESRTGRAIFAGWLNYLRCPGLEDYLPPDIEREALPDGGLLVFSGRERPNADNPDDVARVRRLQRVLDDRTGSSCSAVQNVSRACLSCPRPPRVFANQPGG